MKKKKMNSKQRFKITTARGGQESLGRNWWAWADLGGLYQLSNKTSTRFFSAKKSSIKNEQ
jgi:hypothetical protein